MKYFYKIISLLVFLSFIPCHGDLDIQQKGGISTNEAWQSSEDAESAVYGMMYLFRNTFSDDYMYWGEYRTGLWGKGRESQPARDDVYNNTISATHGRTDWTNLYSTINLANLILKYTPEITFVNDSDKNRIIGDAYFVRAFCYYWIARLWGDAPLCLNGFESDSQEGLYPFREQVDKIYSLIESDLTNAEILLDGIFSPANLPNINAVHALQTDYYLWMYKVVKDDTALAKARKACDAVLGKASLLPNFADVFNVENKLNPEIIFAWSMVKEEKEGGFQADWLVPLQYVTSKYVENPVKVGSHQQWAFITDDYKSILGSVASDTRTKATYDTFFDAEKGITHQWMNKYAGTWENSARIFNSDIIVYRYADILLFDAEIKCAENDPDGAVSSVNIVAQRAYGVQDYYEKGQSVDDVLDIILNERLKEFCAEGKLWWDYIRLGVVFEKVPALKGKENNKNILLWPISQTAINKNNNLVQTEIEY